MKEFTYTVTNPIGIHARPAGLLAKQAQRYASVCTITKGDRTQKLTQLMMLMAMGIKQGDTVLVRAEGEDEDCAIQELENYFKANLSGRASKSRFSRLTKGGESFILQLDKGESVLTG